MTLSSQTRDEIERARDRYPHPRSAILPALWAVQHEFGHLTPEAMADVASLLRVTPSEVEAVSTFYSMYFQKPHGRHEVLVCINVSCALRGADDIVAHLERTLGCKPGETTADGAFTWGATVECLGACGGAPAMQLDHRFVENLTPARVDTVFAEALRSNRQERPGDAGGAQPDAAISEEPRRGGPEGGTTRPGVPGAMVLPPGPQVKRQRTSRGKAER